MAAMRQIPLPLPLHSLQSQRRKLAIFGKSPKTIARFRRFAAGRLEIVKDASFRVTVYAFDGSRFQPPPRGGAGYRMELQMEAQDEISSAPL
jgi:hypothetical protein